MIYSQTHRDVWIDYIKVIACSFVLLGHFFQSMVSANLISIENNCYLWFDKTIYYFHVPLFFICSGYIYQKYSRVNSFQTYGINIVNKLISLGVPYFVFSLITFMLKIVFSDSINNTVQDSLIVSLFLNPLSPYWYLYILFFIFLITPTFNSIRTLRIIIMIALIFKIFLPSVMSFFSLPYFIEKTVCFNFWFLMGMYLPLIKIDKEIKKMTLKTRNNIFYIVLIIAVVAILLSLINFNSRNNLFYIVMGLLFCTVIFILTILLFYKFGELKPMNFLSKYTFPIFLMHTIFASGFRSILFKLRITNLPLHIAVGISVSIICPIIVAIIMNKTKYLEFILYPSKFVKLRKSK